MINNKNTLRDFLREEKKNYSLPKMWHLLAKFNANEQSIIWLYQSRLRRWEYHLNKNHLVRKAIFKYLTKSLGRKYGLSINPNCIDKGLTIKHLGNIIINSNSRVGKNLKIHRNVSIVATSGSPKAPTIGDNCQIGVGAILIGDILISNETVIGAGAVVTKSFNDDNITIAGVPAKIISYRKVK